MSNLVSDHYDYSTDPRCKCRPVHGNADTDGVCRHCRPKVEAAAAKREEAVSVALVRLVNQIERMTEARQAVIFEAVLEAVTERRTGEHDSQDICLLCGWIDECAPGCAVPALRNLVD